MQFFIAVLVFVVVTLAVFAGMSLLDQRKAQARILRERLTAVQKPTEQAAPDVALLRDELLSRIPAFDTLLRRSERVSALQKVLAQGNVNIRAGNFLMLCGVSTVVFAVIAVFAGETKRWFYFPRPEVLEATGLRGNATELFDLVNAAGFPGATVTLRSRCTFEGVEAARAFFDLATRSHDSGNGFDREALAMFQTEKGTFAQFCFGTKRGGQLFLKVLYPQFGGFGWEYAYEKLLRGEKLI